MGTACARRCQTSEGAINSGESWHEEHCYARAGYTERRRIHRDPDVVRQLIASQLERLGLQYVAHLQAIQANGGTCGYVIHVADGSPLEIVRDIAEAVQFTTHSGLFLVAGH